MWEAIDLAVSRRRDEMVDLLARLVRQPSLHGREAGAQSLMAEAMAKLGAEMDIFSPDLKMIGALPGFSPVDWDYTDRHNVVGQIRGTGGGKSLIINGHIDVVSEQPVDRWSYDPWGAEVKGNRMYGRGAGDMKGGLVQYLWALQALQDAAIEIKGDLIMQSVLEEEIGGNGTLACCARGYLADGALVTEPFPVGLLTSMGVMWAYISVPGKTSHASRPEEGVNAIVEAYKLIGAIRTLEDELNAEGHPLYRETDRPIFCNIGTISGGDWPSTLPGDCRFGIRVGFFPGMSIKEVRARLASVLQRAVEESGSVWMRNHPPEINYVGFAAEGCIFDRNSVFAKTLEASHQAVTGEELSYRVARGCCDIRFFNLYQKIPSTTYGALIGNPHAADEWIDLDSLEQAARVTARFIVNWCNSPQS